MGLRRALLAGATVLCVLPCTAQAGGIAAEDHAFPVPAKDTSAVQSGIAPNGYAIVAWSEAVSDTQHQLDVSVRPPGGDWSAPTPMGLTDKILILRAAAINNDGAAAVAWEEAINTTNLLYVSTRSAGGSFTTPEVVDNEEAGGVGVDASGQVTLLYDVEGVGPGNGAFVNTAPAGSPITTASAHRLGTTGCRNAGLVENAAGDALAGLNCSGAGFALRHNGTWTESSLFFNSSTNCPGFSSSTVFTVGGLGIDATGHAAAVVERSDRTSDCGIFMTQKDSLLLATVVGGAMAAGPTIAESGTSFGFGFPPNDVEVPSIGVGGGQVVVGWFAADSSGFNAKPVARVYGSNGTASPGPIESIDGSAPALGFGNLAVSETGSTLYAWAQSLNGKATVHVASRPPAGPFGAAVQASDGSSDVLNTSTHLDALGDGIVTFLQQDGTPYRAHARGFDATPPQLTSVTIPPTAVVGTAAPFAAQAFDLWGPVTFGWDFGDGTATGPTPSHVFSGAGAHPVTVTATDSAGNTSSQTASIAVAPGAAPKAVAPVLSKLSLTHRTFRVGKAATAISAQKRKKKVPTGTTIRFTLDRAGSVAIRSARALPGRKSGKRCVKPTKRLSHAKHCTRFVNARALTRKAKTGRNNIAFSGRIGKRALARGNYRLTVVPSVPGARGKSKETTFKIVR